MAEKTRHHFHHFHHRGKLQVYFPHSAAGRTWELFVLPAIIVLCMFVILRIAGNSPQSTEGEVSITTVLLASLATLIRLLIAYGLALTVGVPLAIITTYSKIAQKLLLPLFDVLQSVPILAFFPVVVALFLNVGLGNGAAIFILFVTMLWSIVFATISGIGLIPRDIIYTAEVFGIQGLSYFRTIILPAIVPQIVVGSILAFAGGWNIIIVAEVLRTYLPANSTVPNLFGLGSMLVYAAAHNNTAAFMLALSAVVGIIALINFFVWQKLLKYAQRFKFEQ